jgi:hypothetical protein
VDALDGEVLTNAALAEAGVLLTQAGVVRGVVGVVQVAVVFEPFDDRVDLRLTGFAGFDPAARVPSGDQLMPPGG